VKVLVCFLLLSAAAFAQVSDSTTKIVTFSRADSEHCKAVVSNGKPLLETSYEGTTVAITMPQNWANGEFSVFVSVTQAGTGSVQINPKEISALYSDPNHTRFRWFDKAHDLETLSSMRDAGLGQPGGASGGPPGPGSLGDSTSTMPPPNHPEARPEMDPHVGTRSEEESRQLQLRNDPRNASSLPKLDPTHPPAFLRHTAVKQGSTAAGYVFFRQPKGSKVEVTSNGMLDEVDIPVNGVIFRF
jgi:hypothetical protein